MLGTLGKVFSRQHFDFFFLLFPENRILSVCVKVLQPSQPIRVMTSVVSLPNLTFTGFTGENRI